MSTPLPRSTWSRGSATPLSARRMSPPSRVLHARDVKSEFDRMLSGTPGRINTRPPRRVSFGTTTSSTPGRNIQALWETYRDTAAQKTQDADQTKSGVGAGASENVDEAPKSPNYEDLPEKSRVDTIGLELGHARSPLRVSFGADDSKNLSTQVAGEFSELLSSTIHTPVQPQMSNNFPRTGGLNTPTPAMAAKFAEYRQKGRDAKKQGDLERNSVLGGSFSRSAYQDDRIRHPLGRSTADGSGAPELYDYLNTKYFNVDPRAFDAVSLDSGVVNGARVVHVAGGAPNFDKEKNAKSVMSETFFEIMNDPARMTSRQLLTQSSIEDLISEESIALTRRLLEELSNDEIQSLSTGFVIELEQLCTAIRRVTTPS